MMRILLFSLLITLDLLAAVIPKNIEAEYDVTFGIFGEIGEAQASLKVEGYEYEIIIDAYSRGLAQMLSSNRRERYESRGRYLNGTYIPREFKKLVRSNNKIDNSVFTFDYEREEVTRYRERTNEEQQIQTDTEILPYFADNDLLTLFFNLSSWYPDLKSHKHLQIKAVGANKKDGIVDIFLPEGEKKSALRELLKSDSERLLIVQVNQKIFASEKGELFISLDEDLLADKALLKGVLIFGDIRGILTEKKIR